MTRDVFYRNIPHYYGDFVRILFLLTAGLAAVAIPVAGDLLPFGLLGQVGMIVLLVLLAGLTHPHGRFIMWCNVAVAGIGTLLLEYAAVRLYDAQSVELFAVRELGAFMLLIALYYGVKTVRAMATHRLGHAEEAGEFSEE